MVGENLIIIFSDHQISYYSIDISDSESFEVLPHKNIEAVLDFAGAMPAKMEGYNPYEYVNTIVMGTLNVLEYAKRINCNRFVFSQSISDILYLFGSENKISADVERRFPVTGDHSVYSICKNAAVNFIEHYAVTYNFKYFILRLPTIYAYHGSPYYYVNGERKYLAYRLLIEKLCEVSLLRFGEILHRKRNYLYKGFASNYKRVSGNDCSRWNL